MKSVFLRVLTCAALSLMLVGCATATSTPEAPVNDLPYADDLLGAVISPPRPIEDFTFASTEGEDFTLSDHRGQVLLLYFGYRSCPDFCPTTFAEMRRLYDALGEPKDRLKILFLTIDPERDTLDMLTAYTHTFHPDFIGLRTEGDSLTQMLRDFGVVATRRNIEGSAVGYLFDHTASVFLIGPDGRLQAQYLYGTAYQDIEHDIELIFASEAA